MARSVGVHCNVNLASGTRANQIESAYARAIPPREPLNLFSTHSPERRV
jgi:hypothetical protein